MKILRKLEEEAHKVGATVERQETGLFVDAPTGKVWKCDFIHTLAVQTENRGGQTWYTQAINELLSRMSMGLEDCTDSDCDICKGE